MGRKPSELTIREFSEVRLTQAKAKELENLGIPYTQDPLYAFEARSNGLMLVGQLGHHVIVGWDEPVVEAVNGSRETNRILSRPGLDAPPPFGQYQQVIEMLDLADLPTEVGMNFLRLTVAHVGGMKAASLMLHERGLHNIAGLPELEEILGISLDDPEERRFERMVELYDANRELLKAQ